MHRGGDELGHRSAELSGWADELRAADPADVDETLAGAVEFAAATGDAARGVDAGDTESAPESTFTCRFCRREVAAAEALDADGLPLGGFEWVADPDLGRREAYHRECIDAGEGRFLPWAASGVLGDE
ncbi:hypothetical protein JCM30237_26830 [Halolamina litorea]|uniref:Uncharacterized protein n=1 Tax=Halolamina litorea TaxID=1515593 RepID=A0ABD6BPG7_9EURY|nr:hypothetical protein [Halolamina litorea]